MRKLKLILTVVCGLALAACTDNTQKEQVNDETKEIEAQSQELGDDVDENDPDDLGHPTDTTDNGSYQEDL